MEILAGSENAVSAAKNAFVGRPVRTGRPKKLITVADKWTEKLIKAGDTINTRNQLRIEQAAPSKDKQTRSSGPRLNAEEFRGDGRGAIRRVRG
ncbi:hypothetical protein Zmor_009303 [Zophobas morio]|uniref:Uncharacterized protein n=1 Tax=Zophobas morio TaxID=2755281 RepID=A0AA38IP07_9CUCU|nr:hypothetical protein Zmor_009303 [Zophobas morio]